MTSEQLQSMTKKQLTQFAALKHGLTLRTNDPKWMLIATIEQHEAFLQLPAKMAQRPNTTMQRIHGHL